MPPGVDWLGLPAQEQNSKAVEAVKTDPQSGIGRTAAEHQLSEQTASAAEAPGALQRWSRHGPGAPAPEDILNLQATLGNRAVARMIALRTGTQRVRPPIGPEGGPASDEVASAIQQQRGSGQTLSSDLQSRFEGGFGTSLEEVRVHTGPAAADLNAQVGARAFTVGSDIFLGANTSPSDQATMAHELTHVVQQRSMPAQGSLKVGSADDPIEQEADATASRLLSTDLGGSAQASRHSGVGRLPIQRQDPPSDDASAGQQVADGSSAAASTPAGPQSAAPDGQSSTANPYAGTDNEQRIVNVHVSAAPGAAGSSSSWPSLHRLSIQRYQAGDTGHGGIEARAMTSPDVGMTSDQASQVYFGNWLRDLSQLPPKALPLINILALGEFNREVTQADLGTYVPSEHLDNPEGGGTVEDPRIQALEHSANPAERAQFEAALAKLSPQQRAAYDEEQKHRAEITEAAKTSGLSEYIEVGKFHAKQTLVKAIGVGATPKGRELMGNALHAVEDYYSHSNFVEACIFMLFRSGAAVEPLVDRMAQTELGANAALAGGLDAGGNPQILTGTYAPGANAWVSKFELIKTEIEHGQLTRAFVLGWLRQQGIDGEDLGARLGGGAGAAMGGAVGAVGGGVSGAISGAAEGAEQGWETHSGVSAVGHAITGFFSGAVEGAEKGGSEGYQEGREEGADIGGDVGGSVGKAAGFVGGTIEEILAVAGLAEVMIAFPEFPIALAALVAAAETDVVAEHETKESAEQAKNMNPPLSGPTHSQLAKDAPDNPLFGVSVQLAEVADREIGAAMQIAWSAADPATSPPATEITDPVANLVDKFVSAPTYDTWWQPIVLGAART